MKRKRMSSRHCQVDTVDRGDSLGCLDKPKLINKKICTGWDEAISDAENSLVEAEQRITDLRLGIKEFRRRKDAGDPWPGMSGDANPETTKTASSERTP